jgi:UDP-glucose:(heptosyl)LPS alpha-1,3-glucosyltransferase
VDFICARQETDAPAGVRVVTVGRPRGPKALKMLWFAMRAEAIRRSANYDLTIGLGKTVCQDILRIGGGPTLAFWNHSAAAYSPGPARAWKQLRRRMSLSHGLGRLIERRQMACSDTLVANSHFVRDCVCSTFPELDRDRFEIIYNRPDLSAFTPGTPDERSRARERFDLPRDKTILLTAGTNFVLKGIPHLIRALHLLPDSHVLAVAGGRKPQKMEQLATSLGIAHRVRFLGRVDDMVSFYRAGDLFALLTFYDACSNAVLEAAACGLPVLSTRTNGSSFFLPESRVIENPWDSSEVAEMIRTALADGLPPIRSELAEIESGLEPYLTRVAAILNTKTNTSDTPV